MNRLNIITITILISFAITVVPMKILKVYKPGLKKIKRILTKKVEILDPGSEKTESDVLCHYVNSSDIGIPVIDETFTPVEHSIYFHETSCKGGLNSREACAVESAAKQNPTFQIHLIFTGGVPDYATSPGSLSTLIMIPNVNINRVHILDYAKNTPLENLVNVGALNGSKYSASQISDVLQYITLYKYGGIHMDLDVIVAKPLESLGRNFAVAEPRPGVVGSAVLAFSWDKVGREISKTAAYEMAWEYSLKSRLHDGPGVITQVLKTRCNTSDVNEMTLERCRGFRVYPTKYFYPLNFRPYAYFRRGKLEKGDNYIYHFWNKVTSRLKVDLESPYVELAKEYCPEIYNLYNETFGT